MAKNKAYNHRATVVFNQTMEKFVSAQTPPNFLKLPKLQVGDGVSIVASSAQIAAQFPLVYDRGIERIRNLYKLNPMELPTTRKSGSSLKERATDLMTAFSNPDSKAVISLIGGNEQILLLSYLNPKVFKDNPKPFFGYSDNTNFCLYLWSLGLPSYYGGCVFTEYAMSGEMNLFTDRYLRMALFESGEREIFPTDQFTDQDLSWEDPENLRVEYEYEINERWFWDGSQPGVGVLWGGCLESIGLELMVDKWMPQPEAVSGSILCLESSELIPEMWYIVDVMTGLGERGFLSELSGLLVARPKSRVIFGEQPSAADRAKYRIEQRETILKEFRRYNKTAPVIMNMDFGHTKPQIPVPFGRSATLDSINKRIWFDF